MRYSFQPGPSQLHPTVPAAIQAALAEGLLSRYHRDPVWKALLKEAQAQVTAYLELPTDWTVAFVSGATEAWQIWVDLMAEYTALHVIQGAFGKRWFALCQAASPYSRSYEWDFAAGAEAQRQKLAERYSSVRSLALVHVETAIGAWLDHLEAWRAAFPQAYMALDATSSLGALPLPWSAVDFVFASVQKAFGLPPGLGILLASPRIQALAAEQPPTRHNSLSYILNRAQQHEPPSTPNLLNIYLLAKTLHDRPRPTAVMPELARRAAALYERLAALGFRPYLPAPYRSPTVLCFYLREGQTLQELRQQVEAQGLYLGWGYGPEKDKTFRLANFPALPDEAFEELLAVIS